jgi:nucleoside-diphosphate-sugar epimerase
MIVITGGAGVLGSAMAKDLAAADEDQLWSIWEGNARVKC